MRIKNQTLTLDGTDLEANIVSDPVWIGHIAYYSIQVVFTGTPSGEFKLQASLDDPDANPTETTITNWTDITGSEETVTAAGDLLWNVESAGYNFVRLVWTDTASANPSVITSARFNLKGV